MDNKDMDLDRLIENHLTALPAGGVWNDERDLLFSAWASQAGTCKEEAALLHACAQVASLIVSAAPGKHDVRMDQELVWQIGLWRRGILVNVEPGAARNALRRWWRKLCDALSFADHRLRQSCAHALALAADLTASKLSPAPLS